MDLSKLKQKALELKNKAVELKNKTIDEAAKKVSESSVVLKNNEELYEFILKSQNTTFTNQNWESKIYTKRCAVIIWDSSLNFFKELLFSLPILLAKWFSQNLPIKVVDIKNESINLTAYNISEFPSLIIFENKEVYKIIVWEDNIKKVVKSLSLDINKTIDEI